MKYQNLEPGVYIWFCEIKNSVKKYCASHKPDIRPLRKIKCKPPSRILFHSILQQKKHKNTILKYGPLFCYYCFRQWRWPSLNKPYPYCLCKSVLYCSFNCFLSDYKSHLPVCLKNRKVSK